MSWTIGIYRSYEYPDLKRQTPGQSGIWKDARFMVDRLTGPCDILVVLNKFSQDVEVDCKEVWLVVQEPPIDIFPWIFEGHEPFNHIFSPVCTENSGKLYHSSHGALPWQVDKNYDELRKLPPGDKKRHCPG